MQTTAPIHTEAETAQVSKAMMEMFFGNFVTQALYVAAKLGIADLLKDGPKTADTLANTVHANPDFLYRVLRTLSSLRVFEESDNKTFSLTPFARTLCSDTPGTLKWMAIMMGEEHYKAWGELKNCVMSGKQAFESVYGMNVFEYFSKNPEASEIFNNAMTGFASQMYKSVVPAYDFSSFKTLVDIGGGHGKLLSGILKNTPGLKGIVFDLPHVVEGATEVLKQEGVADRCAIENGDFFKAVPSADAYIMSHIIHDWDDAHSTTLLKCIHEAIEPNGKVLLVEDVVTGPNTGPSGKLMDLNMMVMTVGGRERTEAEYRALFAGAGFELTRIIPTQGTVSIIEAVVKK